MTNSEWIALIGILITTLISVFGGIATILTRLSKIDHTLGEIKSDLGNMWGHTYNHDKRIKTPEKKHR
ncbi:MAG TPA: hypothetical protein VFE50_16925 [Cyclobacteriaceae bacterium]|nr:hypothetical protein [Cyclobacteriaceae bacterium]